MLRQDQLDYLRAVTAGPGRPKASNNSKTKPAAAPAKPQVDQAQLQEIRQATAILTDNAAGVLRGFIAQETKFALSDMVDSIDIAPDVTINLVDTFRARLGSAVKKVEYELSKVRELAERAAGLLGKPIKNKTTANAPMFEWEFIFETDADEDDGYRKIIAPNKEAAIEELKRQTKGQKIRVSAYQSKKIKTEAMGKRSDGLITKKVNQSIYDVEYKGRQFDLELTDSPGYGKSWQLCEMTQDGDKEYWNHFRTKDQALQAIKQGVDEDPDHIATKSQFAVEAAPPKHEDIAATVKAIFRRAGVDFGQGSSVEVVSRKGGGKILRIISTDKSLTFRNFMRLRAFLTHTFKAKQVTIVPVKIGNTVGLKYWMQLKEIKKKADGKTKLKAKPGRKRIDRKPDTPRKRKAGNKPRVAAQAAFDRIAVFSSRKLG